MRMVLIYTKKFDTHKQSFGDLGYEDQSCIDHLKRHVEHEDEEDLSQQEYKDAPIIFFEFYRIGVEN